MRKVHPDQLEMHKTFGNGKLKPDKNISISRRTFLHKSIVSGGVVGAATYGWWPLINTIDIAHAAGNVNFAWVSDTHLYPKSLNTRFVDKAERAFKEIEAMKGTVTKAELVTEKVTGFEARVVNVKREVEDSWSAMDYLSNPLK